MKTTVGTDKLKWGKAGPPQDKINTTESITITDPIPEKLPESPHSVGERDGLLNADAASVPESPDHNANPNEEELDMDLGFTPKVSYNGETTRQSYMTVSKSMFELEPNRGIFQGQEVARGTSLVRLPVHALSGPSVIAMYQSHINEGLNSAQVSKLMEIHGHNTFKEGARCCGCIKSHPKWPSIAHNSTVIRDGKMLKIPSDNLVPGDLLVINKDETIPADIRIVSGTTDFAMDIGIFSGNKAPSIRITEGVAPDTVPYEAANVGLCGCICVKGNGRGIITETGLARAIARRLCEGEELQNGGKCCTVS